MEVLANTHECLIERQSSLYADDCEIERVGQSKSDSVLAFPDHSLEDETGKKETESAEADQKREIVEPGEQSDRSETNQCHENACAEVVIDVDRVAESSLNQQSAGAGHISRGERNRFAEGIEGLLKSLSNRGFIYRLLLRLSTKRSQTCAENGTRSDHGRAKGEDGCHYGEENEDD